MESKNKNKQISIWEKDNKPFISSGQWFLIYCLIVVVGILILTRIDFYYHGTKEYIKRGWVEKLYCTPQCEVEISDHCRFVSLSKYSRRIYKEDKEKEFDSLPKGNFKTKIPKYFLSVLSDVVN